MATTMIYCILFLQYIIQDMSVVFVIVELVSPALSPLLRLVRLILQNKDKSECESQASEQQVSCTVIKPPNVVERADLHTLG